VQKLPKTLYFCRDYTSIIIESKKLLEKVGTCEGRTKMLFTYIVATLMVCTLIVLSCRMSMMLNTKRTFKKYQRLLKRSRGAVISSPLLQDAIFATNEKYRSFWAAEIEPDPHAGV
jgi:hypothetical protein